MAENGNDNAPHKGYVKLTTLTLTHLKPEKLDKVVVLKAPIPINKGDFIGYIGHHVSQSQRFDEPKETPLANMKRASESQLPRLAHIELFTCNDLPAFINQSQTLADRLPDSEKTVILVEKQAQLIQAHKPDGFLRAGLGITFIGNPSHYYVNIYPQYTLTYPTPSHIAFDTKTNQHRLTKQDKANLIAHYQATYPELTINDIPDEVERITSDSTPANKPTQITLRFMVKNKPYWITSKSVSHLQAKDGELSSDIRYWTQFPLTLDNLPAAKDKDNNIVAYPRTLSLNALTHDGLIAIDDKKEKWVHVTAGNQQGIPITGWVNLKQAHIKQISPWHWHGFNTIEEKATLGELSDKISKNKVATLDLADYTPAMRQLHHILTGTLRYSMQRKKTTQPSFTDGDLKQGLRTSWTAQQIGHLLINYESEWYADEELSKWNEIDSLYEQEKQQKKELIEQELNKLGLTLPYQRDFALKKLNEAHEHIKTNWQLEKEKRIKPSLWWKEVAEAQTANSNQSSVNANTTILSNLSMDGKAWFIHPVAVVNYFPVKPRLWHEPLENPQRTLFSSNTLKFPWNGAFGYVRNEGAKSHAGLDLFADINTPCYACLDGEIACYIPEAKKDSKKGYGNVLVIKVKGDDLRASKNEYTLEFTFQKIKEIVQADDFNINKDYFYIRYCHLSDKRADLNIGDKVKSGDLIGYTGDTGNAKDCCNPHLHIEIAMNPKSNRSSTTKPEIDKLGLKINPAFFINLQEVDEKEQTKVKERRLKEKKTKLRITK